MSVDRLAVEAVALLYALTGYAVLLYMGLRTFAHLCVRWGLVWNDRLNPLALRAAVLSTMPLLGVGLLVMLGLLEPKGPLTQTGLVAGVLAFIALLVYQAWVFAHAAPEGEGQEEDQ